MAQPDPKPELRGDYSRIKPDYTVDQDWESYGGPCSNYGVGSVSASNPHPKKVKLYQ